MVKIITSNISHQDLENKINECIRSCHIKSIQYSITPMHDLYQYDGGVCNQWVDYTAIIIL